MVETPKHPDSDAQPLLSATVEARRGRGMGQRVSYGATAIALILALVLLDIHIARWAATASGAFAELLARGSLLPLTCVAMVVVGAVEFVRLLRATGSRPNVAFALSMVTAMMLAPWLSAAGWLGSGPAQVEGLYGQVVLLALAFVGGGVCLVARGDPSGSLRDFAATVFTILYFGFLGSFAIQLRCGRDVVAQDGAWLLLIAILVTKCSDIGAYFAGSALGRRKLAPKISPGKTVEGMLGGLAASAGASVLFASAGRIASTAGLKGPYGEMFRDMSRAFALSDNNDLVSLIGWALAFGLVLSAVGQLGDLVESCFKRDAGAKDSGKLIPRFGGILDLIDSPLLALPVAWILMTAW
ncbi:MAG: phosphatidate cytidylyltransferase [Planctomycetes bacterium]|nr:phosphatidate cytidylyltransferase [Planctomycetota bacterium]